MKEIRIGSRGSELALAQTNWVKKRLQEICPDCHFTVVEIQTKGDQILDRPLAKIGGKGLFIKEIEQALLEREIDLAVHSMKDMPALLPEGLIIGAVTEREDPRDALISGHGRLAEIPTGGRIGTSSLRRKAQLLAARPDLIVEPLRGNINTRLRKLTEENLDGIILAAAGLARMGWLDRVSEFLDSKQFTPAVGQGALAIEIREDDAQVRDMVEKLNHSDTKDAVTAERGFLERLEGSCQVPVGAFAECLGEEIRLSGFIGSVDGKSIVRKVKSGVRSEAFTLGVELADEVLANGGEKILSNIKEELRK